MKSDDDDENERVHQESWFKIYFIDVAFMKKSIEISNLKIEQNEQKPSKYLHHISKLQNWTELRLMSLEWISKKISRIFEVQNFWLERIHWSKNQNLHKYTAFFGKRTDSSKNLKECIEYSLQFQNSLYFTLKLLFCLVVFSFIFLFLSRFT